MAPPEGLIQTRRFVEEVTRTVASVLGRRFSGLTNGEREDIVQEVVFKIWRQTARGKKIENFKSYLWRVVYTTALDALEIRIHEVSLEDALAGEAVRQPGGLIAEAGEGRKDLRRHVERMLERLPSNRRTVLELYLAGLDHEETAEFLKWTVSKVRHLFYRGLDELRDSVRGGRAASSLMSAGRANGNVFKKAMPQGGRFRPALSK